MGKKLLILSLGFVFFCSILMVLSNNLVSLRVKNLYWIGMIIEWVVESELIVRGFRVGGELIII